MKPSTVQSCTPTPNGFLIVLRSGVHGYSATPLSEGERAKINSSGEAIRC